MGFGKVAGALTSTMARSSSEPFGSLSTRRTISSKKNYPERPG